MATVKPVVKLTKEGLMPANDSINLGADGNEFNEVYVNKFVGKINNENIEDSSISPAKLVGPFPNPPFTDEDGNYLFFVGYKGAKEDPIRNAIGPRHQVILDMFLKNNIPSSWLQGTISKEQIADKVIPSTSDIVDGLTDNQIPAKKVNLPTTMTFSRGYQESNVALGGTVQLYQIGSTIPDSLPEGMLFVQYDGAPSAPATPETAPEGQEDEPTEEPST